MAEHWCIDCKALPVDEQPKAVRPTVVGVAPRRCATHSRAFSLRQKKQKRAASVERTYNISAEDNHELFLFQGGRCWLCQKATGATKSLAVDHDHATDEVRGRLCGPCNQFIGRITDSAEAAQRLVGYLTGDTPYRRLKARQAIAQAERVLPGLERSKIAVHRVYPQSSGVLYAEWSVVVQPAARWHTIVRSSDGVWGVVGGTHAVTAPG